MMTLRYHFGTIIAIFLALGVGIVIGGTLGQPWISTTQHEMFQILAKKYDESTKQNEVMHEQMVDLSRDLERATSQFSTLLTRTMEPVLAGKQVVWLRSSEKDLSLLELVIQSAGGKVKGWTDPVPETLSWESVAEGADIILFSDIELLERWKGELQEQNTSVPVIVLGSQSSLKETAAVESSVSTHKPWVSATELDLSQPESLLQFVHILRAVMERQTLQEGRISP
jgi:hypothetical protein